MRQTRLVNGWPLTSPLGFNTGLGQSPSPHSTFRSLSLSRATVFCVSRSPDGWILFQRPSWEMVQHGSANPGARLWWHGGPHCHHALRHRSGMPSSVRWSRIRKPKKGLQRTRLARVIQLVFYSVHVFGVTRESAPVKALERFVNFSSIGDMGRLFGCWTWTPA